MKLINPLEARNAKLSSMAQGGLVLMAFLFSLCWLLSLAWEKQESSFSARSLPMPKLDYLKIGKGPISIAPKMVSPELEPLVQEIVLMGKNTRPDSGVLTTINLGLKTSGAKKELVSGQKLFLSKNGPVYQFSDQQTDLAILPISLPGDEVLLQIEAPGLKEEIVLAPSPLFQKSLEDEFYVQSLKKGKTWAPDMFLHQWGGEEYRDLSSKHKIEIDNRVYFLSIGDTLWWDGDAWNTGSPEFQNSPAAKVVSCTPQGMKIEVWDPTGYASSCLLLALEKSSRTPLKPEEVITSVRPRAPTEVTCQLGKRRVIVKEGDWWVKTDRRWRPLKNTQDLEAFLYHQIQGELFIFDKVETVKGKAILKGRCFDKMRTESQPLSLVVNTDKKASAQHKHRNEPSQASMIAKNKMTVPPLQHQTSDGEEKQ